MIIQGSIKVSVSTDRDEDATLEAVGRWIHGDDLPAWVALEEIETDMHTGPRPRPARFPIKSAWAIRAEKLARGKR